MIESKYLLAYIIHHQAGFVKLVVRPSAAWKIARFALPCVLCLERIES
jgi:hypothetical protein